MKVKLNEVELEAELHVSAKSEGPFYILSHPHPVYGGTMKNKVIELIFRRCVKRDYSVLRYNMRGIGESSGAFDEGIGEKHDLHQLVEWSSKNPNIAKDRILIVGYSFGSWISANVAATLQKPCLLIAPPVSLYSFPVLDSNRQKLIFSAEKDELIPLQAIEKYFDSIAQPKKHVLIQDADHYFIGTTNALIRSVFETIDQIDI